MTEILHNRIRWLLAALMLLLTSGGISAATETVTRLYDGTLLTKTVRTVDGVQYTHLSWLGLDATRMPGAPEMPVEYIRFLVPVYTNNFRVTVTAGGLSRQTLGARVFPSQEPVLASYEGPVEFTAPNPQYYSATQPIRAEYIEDGFVDGCNHIVTVAVYPASYDDATLSVTTASTVTVTLEYDSCTATELESTPIFPPRASKYLDLKSMVINGERTANRLYAPREKASPDAPEYYYIITPRNLEEAFQDLAIWKRQKGYNVIVKCIEDVYADPRYRIGAMYSLKNETPQQVVDSAMSLRCYLKDQYQLNGHFFCLLAGDWRTPMPIRKATANDSIIHRDKDGNPIDTVYCTDNCQDAIPADIYFSNLTKNFKLVKRSRMSIFSLDQTKIEFLPAIAIGRIQCASPREVMNYFYKLRIYESNPGYGQNDYLKRGVFIEGCKITWSAETHGFVHDVGGCMIGESNKLRKETNFLDSITLFQDQYHLVVDTTAVRNPQAFVSQDDDGPRAQEVMNAMKDAGFSSWHVHGTPSGIACGAHGQVIYSNDDRIGISPYDSPYYKNYPHSGLNNMDNIGKPSIVYSISCTNAPFDCYTVNEHKPNEVRYTWPNLGRTWTTEGQNGGAAAIMNSRPGIVGSSANVEVKWLNNIKTCPKIGEAFRHTECKDSVNRYILTQLYVLGDPELEMWLGKPKNLNIEISSSRNNIHITGELPDSVLMVVYNGEASRTLCTKARIGLINSGINSGEYCVSLWKSMYLPFITLFAQNGELASSKKYVVRKAILGDSISEPSANQVYKVINGGKLEVEAIDNISAYSGFIIENGGEVILKCDRNIDLNGVTVKKGGKLTVIARNVTMGKDFKIEDGGEFKISNR